MDALDMFNPRVSGVNISGAAGPAPNVSSSQGSMRRLLAAAASTLVTTVTTQDITANISQAFKPERMYVNAALATALYLINNLRIATFSLNVSSNPLPIDMFLRDAVGTELSGYTAQAGVGMVINVTNPSGASVQTNLGFIGWSLVEG